MHEINLVPEVKTRLLRLIRLRNVVLFICLVVVGVSVGVVAILGSVAGGQRIAMESKKSQIEALSGKLGEYSTLGELLTIQGQLSGISEVDSRKVVLSRIFNVLDAMVPQGDDKVNISELSIDLETMTLSMEAQADAGKEPFIDYRVLESFKKGVSLTRYDYGRYVDEEGNEIPTICITEADAEGNLLRRDGSVYALWSKNQEGCNPAGEKAKEEAEAEDAEETDGEGTSEGEEKQEDEDKEEEIWRTPQFKKWYESKKMNEDGEISGVPHFESQCIDYKGSMLNNEMRWTATYNDDENCVLTEEGLVVQDSSNGKDANNKLVLRFTASLVLRPEVFSFSNKHMMIIGPVAQDVTDSYKQIEGMFVKKAEDCDAGDTECATNTLNRTGKSGEE